MITLVLSTIAALLASAVLEIRHRHRIHQRMQANVATLMGR